MHPNAIYVVLMMVAVPTGADTHGYTLAGDGWCRDAEGLSTGYWLSWSVKTTGDCAQWCNKYEGCIAVGVYSPQCALMMVEDDLSAPPADWSVYKGTGATNITTGSGVKGPSCYIRPPAPPSESAAGAASSTFTPLVLSLCLLSSVCIAVSLSAILFHHRSSMGEILCGSGKEQPSKKEITKETLKQQLKAEMLALDPPDPWTVHEVQVYNSLLQKEGR
eukprot:TRINITY_DN1763_c0_g1_i1.p1 TRINITY_DN1763_c0_g1~~TRINITY_DN1763_c0_g1_i1.p1  ORF type:complete len:237 (+),score=53.37 TRINITY_DN1763_c0_g1_i1:55-711(+)